MRRRCSRTSAGAGRTCHVEAVRAVTDVRRLERERRKVAGQVADRSIHRDEMRCLHELLRERDMG